MDAPIAETASAIEESVPIAKEPTAIITTTSEPEVVEEASAAAAEPEPSSIHVEPAEDSAEVIQDTEQVNAAAAVKVKSEILPAHGNVETVEVSRALARAFH